MFPEIHVASWLTISTYFLIISIGSVLGSLWFVRRAEARGLERVDAIDLTLVVLVSGFIGARLLHVFYEDPGYYRVQPWDVLKIWNGGFVFLGGVVASFAAALTFCQVKRMPFWFWADAAALPISVAYAVGRLACFFNGCCYGRECDLPWAVHFDGVARHPTQLYASGWEFVLLVVLSRLEPRLKTSGVLFNLWLFGHAVGRLLMEEFRADFRGDLLIGYSLGSFMALVLATYAMFNLCSVLIRRGR